MEQLLCLREKDGKPVMSARDLYDFLEVKTDFSNWCKRMFDYGFIEDVDYSLTIFGERTVHNKSDYALTIDCAKEISMVQRSEKGKQARAYFIECEKKLKDVAKPMSQLDMIIQSALELKRQDERTTMLETKVIQLEAKSQTTPNYFTTVGFANVYNIKNLGVHQSSTAGKKATALCNRQGIKIEKTHDPRFGYVNLYPAHVLKEVFKEYLTN